MAQLPKIKANDIITVVFFGTRKYKVIGNNTRYIKNNTITKSDLRLSILRKGMFSNITKVERDGKIIYRGERQMKEQVMAIINTPKSCEECYLNYLCLDCPIEIEDVEKYSTQRHPQCPLQPIPTLPSDVELYFSILNWYTLTGRGIHALAQLRTYIQKQDNKLNEIEGVFNWIALKGTHTDRGYILIGDEPFEIPLTLYGDLELIKQILKR